MTTGSRWEGLHTGHLMRWPTHRRRKKMGRRGCAWNSVSFFWGVLLRRPFMHLFMPLQVARHQRLEHLFPGLEHLFRWFFSLSLYMVF